MLLELLCYPLVFLLLHWRGFRAVVVSALRRLWSSVLALCRDLPAYLLDLPWLRAVLGSRPFRLFWAFMAKPAALALRPELDDVLVAGADLGALGGIVSGSGPTCAFLCAHADAAQDLAVELDRARVCVATQVATAPAPGARITG